MIIEILEEEARKRAEQWAKNMKVMTGSYPTLDRYFEMKSSFFEMLCRQAYNELSDVIQESRKEK